MSTAYARPIRTHFALLTALVGWAGLQSGCCQHACYQPQMGCPPVAAQAGVLRYGAVCEAPGPGGTIISQAPSRSSSIADAPRPRVVVSEPGGRLAGGGWRRTDPESLATTRVEGSLDDSTTTR